MSANPLVSIIIPLYNAETYIGQCIQSVLKQTWPNIEVIVIDDGSTDGSFNIAKSLESQVVKLFAQPNSGASIARNLGLKIATGQYIQFLDADDLLSENKIEEQVLLLEKNKECIAVCGTVYFDDGSDPYLSEPLKEWYNNGSDDPVDFLLKLYAGPEVITGHGGMIQPNAWLTPRNLIDKAGPWNEFRCPDDDGEFFCRVILAAEGIRFSNKGINYYRKFNTGKSLSGQRTREALENIRLGIDLKYSYLKEKADSGLLNAIFAKHYWELGVNSYPEYKDISASAIQKAEQFDYKGPKYSGGKFAAMLSKVVGWRVAKLLSIVKHKYIRYK